MTKTQTIEIGSGYGDAEVTFVPSEYLPGRYDVRTTDADGNAVRVGWVFKNDTGTRWTAYATKYAMGLNDNGAETIPEGTKVGENDPTRLSATESLLWAIACRGRRWLVGVANGI